MPDREKALAAWYGLMKGRLGPGERGVLPVLTGSMAPLMRPGNEIVVEAVTWRDCRRGDVIVFADSERLTAHRLLWLARLPRGPFLYQKGDLNPRGAWIRAGRVVGRVVAVAGGELAAGDIATASVDLTTASQRSAAAREARRQLARDLRQRLLAGPRRIKRWLERWSKRTPASSG